MKVENLALVFTSLVAHATSASVAPMLQTNWEQGSKNSWDQSSVYSQNTPKIGSEGTLLGCVAVAFGQVHKYYNYPKRGLSLNEYCNDRELSLSNCPKEQINYYEYDKKFDWANMPNRLDRRSTPDQVEAVSDFMYGVAVSVNAIFGTEGTNAQIERPKIFNQLRKHLQMVDAELVSQNMYLSTPGNTKETWKAMIHAEIEAGRPVILTGFDSKVNAGHGYVLDGLNEKGQVHINFGWGGSANGWYDVNDIVVGRYRFTEDAHAFINLTPNIIPEGDRCNGKRGARCKSDLVCAFNGDITQILDENTSDDYGICIDKNSKPPAPPVDKLKEVKTSFESIEIKKGEWKYFGPFTSLNSLSATMKGQNGDSDLYVQLGSKPTLKEYICRPYRSNSNEQCKGTEGNGDFYVGINGFRDDIVSLDITYYVEDTSLNAENQKDLVAREIEPPLERNVPFLVAAGMGVAGIAAAVVVTAKVTKKNNPTTYEITV